MLLLSISLRVRGLLRWVLDRHLKGAEVRGEVSEEKRREGKGKDVLGY